MFRPTPALLSHHRNCTGFHLVQNFGELLVTFVEAVSLRHQSTLLLLQFSHDALSLDVHVRALCLELLNPFCNLEHSKTQNFYCVSVSVID